MMENPMKLTKTLILTTAMCLALPAFAEPRNDVQPGPTVNNTSAHAHVGIVQSESNSSATATGGSGTGIGIGGQGGKGGKGGAGGTAINGGNSNSINIEGDEAAASSAYAGAQFAADLCNGTAAFGIGAQTIGAGISLSFRGADRFCQVRAVAGDRAAVAYLASVDRHARKAFEAAGIIAPKTSASVSSKSRTAAASGTLYARCDLQGRTLYFAPTAGVDRDAALRACKQAAGVR
jgi:hypothetical protein